MTNIAQIDNKDKSVGWCAWDSNQGWQDGAMAGPHVNNSSCGQSYEATTIIMNVSRVINISNLLVSMTLES